MHFLLYWICLCSLKFFADLYGFLTVYVNLWLCLCSRIWRRQQACVPQRHLADQGADSGQSSCWCSIDSEKLRRPKVLGKMIKSSLFEYRHSKKTKHKGDYQEKGTNYLWMPCVVSALHTFCTQVFRSINESGWNWFIELKNRK